MVKRAMKEINIETKMLKAKGNEATEGQRPAYSHLLKYVREEGGCTFKSLIMTILKFNDSGQTVSMR